MFLDQAAERAGAAVVEFGIGFDQRQDMRQNLLQCGVLQCLQVFVDRIDDQPFVLLVPAACAALLNWENSCSRVVFTRDGSV